MSLPVTNWEKAKLEKPESRQNDMTTTVANQSNPQTRFSATTNELLNKMFYGLQDLSISIKPLVSHILNIIKR